jgi:hypothetical protein
MNCCVPWQPRSFPTGFGVFDQFLSDRFSMTAGQEWIWERANRRAFAFLAESQAKTLPTAVYGSHGGADAFTVFRGWRWLRTGHKILSAA